MDAEKGAAKPDNRRALIGMSVTDIFIIGWPSVNTEGDGHLGARTLTRLGDSRQPFCSHYVCTIHYTTSNLCTM